MVGMGDLDFMLKPFSPPADDAFLANGQQFFNIITFGSEKDNFNLARFIFSKNPPWPATLARRFIMFGDKHF